VAGRIISRDHDENGNKKKTKELKQKNDELEVRVKALENK